MPSITYCIDYSEFLGDVWEIKIVKSGDESFDIRMSSDGGELVTVIGYHDRWLYDLDPENLPQQTEYLENWNGGVDKFPTVEAALEVINRFIQENAYYTRTSQVVVSLDDLAFAKLSQGRMEFDCAGNHHHYYQGQPL